MRNRIVVEGVEVRLVRQFRSPTTNEPTRWPAAFWDAYVDDEEPLTLGNAQPTRRDLVEWLHSEAGRMAVRKELKS